MHRNPWDISRERDEVELRAEQSERFRVLEPLPPAKAIDDAIVNHIKEVVTEQSRIERMKAVVAGIWGRRAKGDVDSDWRLGSGRLFPKPWSEMTLREKYDLAEQTAESWDRDR